VPLTTDFDIVSPSNPRVKRLLRLASRRDREAEGVFVVEGRRLFDRAIGAGLTPLEVYVSGGIDIDHPKPVTMRTEVMDRVSYRGRSQGLIAVFPQRVWTLEMVELSDPALVLVTEGIEKPGNLGAILRTAEGVGADAVISLSGKVDVFNPNVLRASTGASFALPTVETELADLRPWLDERHIALVATTPEAPLAYWDSDLTGPVALLVGAEDKGLTESALEEATISVSVPMLPGAVDSLNMSVTMALIAYECRRQRRSA
jgi:RNA methyltransferase, TrmH family